MSQVDPLYNELATKITRENNKTLPLVLERIANLQQARIMRELPNTTEGIANALTLDNATVEKDLRYLFERGLVASGRRGWNLVNNIILVKDRVASANHKYDDVELFDLMRKMSLESSDNLEERVKNGEEISVREGMRVVPKWRTIKDIPGVLPIEDAREIFKNPPIVIHDCPCRVVYRARPCKDTVPIDVCLAAGRTGQYFLERNAGREITYDELIEFLDKLDAYEYPLVSLTGNSSRMPSILCSCCTDCCGIFIRSARTKPVLGKVAYAKSRFVVEDNPEECTACGDCMDNRCPVNAISMKEYPGLEGERAYTDNEECIGCGLCVITCPTEARKMKLVRPPEHIPDPASIFDR